MCDIILFGSWHDVEFVSSALRRGGVKGDMFDHKFVSSVLQLVGEHCPNVCINLCHPLCSSLLDL